jgi:hypothetical protein
MPLLAVLREETDPQREIEIDLDLRACDVPEKLVSREPPRREGAYQIVDSDFRDAWMSGRAELRDGARLAWTVVDEIREQRRTKQNARGKVKRKTRYKKRSIMKASVELPAALYAAGSAAAAGGAGSGAAFAAAAAASAGPPAKVRLSAGEGAQTIKVARVVKSASLEPPDALNLIDLLGTAYRRVDPRPQAPQP